MDLKEISLQVQAGKAKKVKELVQQAIDEGIAAQTILDEGLFDGMNIVGEKFKRNEMFVPDVLMTARAMNMGVALLKPMFSEANRKAVGKVCIGTVSGDLHDIGKNLVKMMLEASIEQFFQRDILAQNHLTYVDALNEVVNILMY